jgi:SAM-dependent methyltransferase
MTQETNPSIRFRDYNRFDQYFVEQDGVQFRVEDYDEKGLTWHNLFNSMLPAKESLPVIRGEVRALDLGCNTGYSVRELKEKYGYAAGVDVNHTLIMWSEYNADNCHLMPMEDLEFKDGSFSLVTAKDVLEHSTDPMKALSEVYRVLADGGQLVALIPLDGEYTGVDDVAVHPAFNFNNRSHAWKATQDGVFRRLFKLGFTDIVFGMYSHSGLFGEKRELGDNVLLVRATKRKDVVKVPWHYLSSDAYWAAFLTFVCTGNCSYCIQHVCKDEFVQARAEYEKNKLSGKEWLEYYNKLQRWGGQRLGLIGGEPTMHPDFFEIVNGLEGYYKTVTTNLSTTAINGFGELIEDKSSIRVNTSFHPDIIDVDNFAHRIHLLREQGFNVDQIAMVDHPGVDFRRYHTEFVKRGITITPQTFLGKYNGELFPNDESSLAKDYGETGINNQELYKFGFSCQEKKETICHTGRFLVAPDGGVYRCHYQLYSRRDKQGDVKDFQMPIDQDFRMCNDFGFCNPCDFPHVQFKAPAIPIDQLAMGICLGDQAIAENATKMIADFTERDERHQEIFTEIFNVLYSSTNPWWELYNNEALHKTINDYINEGGMVENDHLDFFVTFEQGVIKAMPYAVNIYRIFDDTALVKYLANSSVAQAAVFLHHFPKLREFFDADPMLIQPLLSKILCTFGTLLGYTNIYYQEGTREGYEKAK